MANEEITRYADIFTALGSEPRLEIMRLLFAAHPIGMTVGELQAQLKIPSSTLSHHLEKLRIEGLVSSRRDKQFLWYSAEASTVEALLSFLYSGCAVDSQTLTSSQACDVKYLIEPASAPSKENTVMFGNFLRSLSDLLIGLFDRVALPVGFERFTPKAMQSVFFAQDESRRLKHAFIGTEQLLLGLLEEKTGIASQVLTAAGVHGDRVRVEIETLIGQGKGTPPTIPFTPRAKQTLGLALDQARQLGRHHVDTEHLLLGILREGKGLAAKVLENLGLNLKALEQQVLQAAMPPE
ncbi:ArsR/SmtB family transcription factor [Stenomitos frigidus]|uniref:Clp protease n=1 Tax=Stenomitos frigidus ULC18 TaxID=2107698 RepID=A0A2T1DXG1_9CYAN|nr:metalloregulator ArsR/SmtB family transcription factor [Stenomitos frigidus]PSB25159.1 Clp protease [Stenomitos frigidus ULC18]